MSTKKNDEVIQKKIVERLKSIVKKGSLDNSGHTGGVRGVSVSLWHQLWDDPDGGYRDGEHLVKITTEGLDNMGLTAMINVFGSDVMWHCNAFIYEKEIDKDHVDFYLVEGEPYIDLFIHISSTDLIRILGHEFLACVRNEEGLSAILRNWQTNCNMERVEIIKISEYSILIKLAQDSVENKSLLELMSLINKEFPLSVPIQNYMIENSGSTSIITKFLTK